MEDQEQMRRKKIKNEVVDLTKDGVDSDMKTYLALGPDFCETTKGPCEKIIAETEKMRTMIKEKKARLGKLEREISEIRENFKFILKKKLDIENIKRT